MPAMSDLLKIAREQFLFDVTAPYKWSDSYLTYLFTQAEKEASKRSSLIKDTSTWTANNSASGTATSTTANKLVDSGAAFTTAMIGLTVFNETNQTWTTITARDSATELSLSADIIESGDSYTIADTSKALTRVFVESGTNEYALSDKIIKIDKCYLSSQGKDKPLVQMLEVNSEAEGTPLLYTYERKKISLYPYPDDSLNDNTGSDILYLEVYRTPLSDLTASSDCTPEIDEEYHFDLIHYVCAKAFEKQDDAAIDPTKALWHEARFTDKFGTSMSHRDETILKMIPSNFQLSRSKFGL